MVTQTQSAHAELTWKLKWKLLLAGRVSTAINVTKPWLHSLGTSLLFVGPRPHEIVLINIAVNSALAKCAALQLRRLTSTSTEAWRAH
jgi:hypothetical protein